MPVLLRGLSPLIATLSTLLAAPVIDLTRAAGARARTGTLRRPIVSIAAHRAPKTCKLLMLVAVSPHSPGGVVVSAGGAPRED